VTLSGKVVAITGSESGIGRAMAMRCAAEGAGVAILALDAQMAAATADEIGGAGGTAIAVATDVRDPGLVEAALDRTIDALGRLDAVIANAGITQIPVEFVDIPLDTWQNVLATNLTGVFLTLQSGARRLIAQGEGGSLIATGSSTVLRPHGAKALSYVAAKGGVHTMIRALAFELSPYGIRVNGIAPGLTETPMTRNVPGHIENGLQLVPMGEVVQPEELGALAAFMLRDDVRHMSGGIVQLDAARTAD
jgi:NAD(P)-dependent dehydrogenase (short-subunit alcohol dehydrogenase family)